jgi:hypothetical protein
VRERYFRVTRGYESASGIAVEMRLLLENSHRVSLCLFSSETEMSTTDIGKAICVAGVLIVAVGALLWSGFGKGWLGKLPGDINYSNGNFSFHFPIVTCLVLSAVLTLLMWLFRK